MGYIITDVALARPGVDTSRSVLTCRTDMVPLIAVGGLALIPADVVAVVTDIALATMPTTALGVTVWVGRVALGVVTTGITEVPIHT